MNPLRSAARFAFFWQRQVARRPGAAIALGSLAFIALATLTPFDFDPATVPALPAIRDEFLRPSHFRDRISNIFFFIPLGIGLGSWLGGQKSFAVRTTTIVAALGFATSLAVECLQLLLPSRTSSVDDLITNTLGTIVGYAIIRLWKAIVPLRMLASWQAHRSRATLLAILLAYTGAIAALTASLYTGNPLSAWDRSFPLVVGNEYQADRPWQGTISKLWIADRALDATEVKQLLNGPGDNTLQPPPGTIARYHLLPPVFRYPDLTGNLPDLVGAGPEAAILTPTVGPARWLETPAPVAPLTQRLQASSQFAIGWRFATEQPHQTGPARLISISGGSQARNLTLAQMGTALSIRLRTTATDKNGLYPSVLIPNAFADTAPHDAIVTFDGAILRFYLNAATAPQTVDLAIASFPTQLFPLRDLTPLAAWSCKALYYAAILTPAVVLSQAIAARGRWRLLARVAGVLMPPAIVSAVLQVTAAPVTAPADLALSLAIAAGLALAIGNYQQNTPRGNPHTV